jgi:hypothetical protein
MALLQLIIPLIHNSGTFYSSFLFNYFYYFDTKYGCTMISGEYVLIAKDDALLVKICPRSPPTFNAEIAE